MKRYDYFKFLVIVLMLIFMTGCGTSIFTTPSEPVINSFTADPLTITAGGSSTLAWNVSNATSVSIDHEVGSSLALISSATVFPTATTTYTLTATNATGTVTATAQVVVTTAPPTGKPDLIITDIRKSGSTIYYKIKNQDTANAGVSYSKLIIDGTERAVDYVAPLAIGVEREESFAYSYTCSGTSDTITVYADKDNDVSESDEGNNQRSETWSCLVIILKPDLVITGISKTETASGYIIKYTIKNQGTADAGASTTKLYANGTYKTSDNVPSVAAGASVNKYFGGWKYNPTTPIIKVIADTGNAVDESDEGNNELQVSIAVEKVYDFVANASSASWKSGDPYTNLSFPGNINDDEGFACYRTNIKMENGITYSKVLETHPKWVDDGWIDGTYTIGHTIKPGEHFYARVGFIQNANAGDVYFTVYLNLVGGYPTWTKIANVHDTYDGKIKIIDINLEQYSGKKANYLWVEVDANGSAAQDWATWVEAKIIR